MLSLFSDPVPNSRAGFVAVAASSLVHAAAVVAFTGGYGIAMRQPVLPKHYQVHLLELEIPRAAAPVDHTLTWRPGRASSAQLLHTARLAKNRAPQTLILPGAPPELQLPRPVPVPFALAWLDPGSHLEPLGRVMQGNDARPSTATGIQPTSAGLPLSGLADLPPKASVISQPPVPLTATGALPLPEVAQSADSANSNASGMASRAGVLEQATEGDLTAKLNAALREAAPGKSADPARPGEDRRDATVQPDQAAGKSAGLARLDLPPDGQFPVSVLGPSVSAQYPDITSALTGRIVSTVYLKLGLKTSWTLEFCACTAGASSADLSPPWAYTLFRPDNLEMPPGTDAVLVSGGLNTNGQLEDLHVLLPPEWPQGDFLLNALGQWRFRPAARNGAPVAVQVLLVIPREP